MAKPRVAIIGRGSVGQALAKGLSRAGYEARTVGREPAKVREAAQWGEVVVLAVPFPELDNALREMGDAVRGKVLVDPTNVLTPSYELALGFTTSGAEELQRNAPEARVVKAFNTVFAQNMETGKVKGEPLACLVAGDDPQAKGTVLDMARAIGFEAVDAGPLRNARHLEPLGYLNIQLGYTLKMGTGIGFRLVH